MTDVVEQFKSVQGYCPECRLRVGMRLTRVEAAEASEALTAVGFAGTCDPAGHLLREIDARGYWRSG